MFGEPNLKISVDTTASADVPSSVTKTTDTTSTLQPPPPPLQKPTVKVLTEKEASTRNILQQGASHEVSKTGQTNASQNHKMIADIEDWHHGPSDAMHNPSYHSSFHLERNLSHLSRRLNMQLLLSTHFETLSDTKDHYKDEMGDGDTQFPGNCRTWMAKVTNAYDLPARYEVFCVEHRSYKFHECSNSDHNSRKVLGCETCSMSMEILQNSKGGKEEMALILAKHEKHEDCDPKKKKNLTCGVRRCKEILMFLNTSSCKSCQIKFCLKHSFQSDHYCKSKNMPAMAATARVSGGARPFLVSLASRMGQDCGKKNNGSKIVERRTML
ncbi:zinc finger AN1 domain-containing stress-associated protein 12 [Tanacetum coccineum]